MESRYDANPATGPNWNSPNQPVAYGETNTTVVYASRPQPAYYGGGHHKPHGAVHIHTVAAPTGAAYAYSDDRLDQRYRTCCCHVKTAVYIIGTLEAIGLIVALITAITQYVTEPTEPDYWDEIIGCAVSFCLGAIVLLCLFLGVAREVPTLLVPHIVFQAVALAAFVFGIIVYIIAAVGGVAWAPVYVADSLSETLTVAIIIIVVFGIALLIEVYFLVQVVKCYRYLRLRSLSSW